MFVYYLWPLIKESNILMIIALSLIIRLIFQWWNHIKSLPPGPWGIPIFGCLLNVKGDQHIFYRNLTQKYGSIISAQLGSHLIVVLSDYQLIRKAFRAKEFTNRPDNAFIRILQGYGVINVEGKLWKDQRRFLHERLRRFGMTAGAKKELMEKRIMTQVDDFVQCLKNSEGQEVDLNPLLAVTISNVICDILMSVKFSYNDKKFLYFMEMIDEGFRLFGSLETTIFIPILRYWPRHSVTLQKLAKNRAELADFFQESISHHRNTYNPNNMRDLVDTYLYEIEKAKEEGTIDLLFEGRDPDKQMQQILGDLFSAGMETIKVSLQWAILLMLHNPGHMKQVQDELDRVVGRSRLPKLDDQKSLPITESTIMEILRISSIVPMGTTHAPIKDTTINGYRIPRNAQIVPLLHAVHMDPNLWQNPEKFDPSRFINEEGQVYSPEYFLPFGVGRRQCLGEVLAKMEIFLIFTTLMHSFNFTVPESTPLPNLKGIVGVTISPKPYKVCVTPRDLCNNNA